jgi:hypothetical protein
VERDGMKKNLFYLILIIATIFQLGEVIAISQKIHIPVKKYYKKDFKKLLSIPYFNKIVLATQEPLYIDITKEDRYINNQNDWRSYLRRYGRCIDRCKTAPLYVAKVNDQVGFGCFADRKIKKGSFIGAFTGHLMKKKHVTVDADYIVPYPSVVSSEKDGLIEFVINARYGGNYTHFINSSSKNPNVECRFVPKNGFWQVIYLALRTIYRNEQLLVNYGATYYETRGKVEVEL